MSSSNWTDFYNGILSNEVMIFDSKGPVPKEKIEEFFSQGKNKLVLHASIRWAVGIDEDQKMMVSLNGLCASITTLESNPIFKG